MNELHKNILAILIIPCVILAMCGCTNIQYERKKTYTEIGEFTFYCIEIARQPIEESTGGYDEENGRYWSGITCSPGYVYMQTSDGLYGFYMPVYYEINALDDVPPKEVMILQDSNGTLCYIQTGYEPNNYQEAVLETDYFSELPEEE